MKPRLDLTKSKSALTIAMALLAILTSRASGEIFGGIDFPNGISSFADAVINYDCSFQGGLCPSPQYMDTSEYNVELLPRRLP